MKILFLTNLLPYPLDNGGKIKTYTTLKSLKSTDNKIDLVCFTEDEKLSEEAKFNIAHVCSSITQISWKLTTSLNKIYMVKVAIRSLFSKYSFSLLKYVSPGLIDELKKLCKKNNYDCVYFDHLQMCVYFDIVKKMLPNAKYILDEHNCEYLIMQRNASNSKNFFKKSFLTLETIKLRKFEAEHLKKFDEVIVLSKEDENMLKSISGPNVKTVVIPIGMEFPQKTLQVSGNDISIINILFVGTLSWAPNNDGILWFIENVLPKLKKRGIKFKLIIVGKNPGDNLRNVVKGFDDIELVGYVESVFPYYEKCDCMIVPLFVGSGQRVKIIEGFSLGMPIISTSIGVEGLKHFDGENILIANDANEFVEKILLMKNGSLRKKLSAKARTIFIENYSIDAVKKMICSTIDKSTL